MATEGKFGTFAGVYTPSLLTILGVIMYLRLPWVVGQAGLYVAIGILLAAHVASVSTGLSVSSIATDKKVGAGGPYYIISRSFGLPIGGAIGVALFLGLSFSASLYIVGFSQSFLTSIGVEPTANAIRICGSITLIAITVLSFISTSLAIKSQYVILALIAGSLIAVFFGRTTSTAPHLSAAPESPSFAVMFGIFFPAVTGFMAGVNMSGDLRDPKGAIPRGTMLAIASGFVVYAGLIVYLGLTVDPAQLRDDPEVLQHVALWAPAVVAGIWGATLSSALGSILGAPRILQAMSADRITPRALAKGVGPTNEPRRALMVAFVIAEAGILIAELNLIARVVSMVFLALYAAINATCAIESWASPDFRPRFRIPKLVSIVGAVTSLLLMIQLDLVAMLGATGLMLGLFVYLKRRQLSLEAGDTWEGVWSTVVRAGLQRLHRKAGDRRNWRPNVLLFDEADHPDHAAIRAFAATLASGNGMVTDFALAPPPRDGDDSADPAPVSAAAGTLGVFDARLETTRPLETIASVCQHHGFSGVPPNTLLLPWRHHAADPDEFLRALKTAARRGLNLLLFEEARSLERTRSRRIDIWWAREAGNLALSVALARFITRAPEWDGAAITVLIVGEGGDDDEVLRAKATRYLDASRVEARVRVVHRPRGERLHDLVCNESRPADLVLLGLPSDLDGADRDSLERLGRVAALPGSVVFLRASQDFADVLVATARPARARAESEPAAAAPVAALPLPAHAELARTAEAIGLHRRAQLARVHDRIAAAYGIYIDLCATARDLVEQRTAAMISAAREADAKVRRRVAGRATATFVGEGERALAAIEADGIAAQATLLGQEIAALLAPDAALPAPMTAIIRIDRPRAEFHASPDDPAALRGWKRRRRWRWFYRRRIPQVIAIGALARRGHERIVTDEVVRMIARFRTASHDLCVEVSRALATVEWKAHAQLSRATVDDAGSLIERLERSRDEALRRLDGIRAHTHERIAEHRAALDAALLDGARRLSHILDRVDAPLVARAAARDRGDRAALAALTEVADHWRDEQLHLLKRAHLAVRLARFRDRLTVASATTLEEIVEAIHESGFRACSELCAALSHPSSAGALALREELHHDASPIVARFARTAAALTGDLPETETVLADEAATALVRGDDATELSTVPVRGSVQAIVETELIARLGSETMRFAEADARAWAVARDTVLLVSARPRESDDDDAGPSTGGEPMADARARLEAQLTRLREVEIAFVRGVIDGLEAVAAATGLDGLSTSLDEHSGRGHERERPSHVRAVIRRGVARLRELAATAIYRRSAGVVYATETRASRARSAAHTIRSLSERSAIAAPVLAALPLYYRNLFIGQININESFFTGRQAQIEAGVAGLTAPRAGALRTALVTGIRGSGKTTLCQQIATAAGGAVHWVTAPPGGAANREAFRAAVEAAVGERGAPAQIVSRLDPGSLIVIDDLDLWWERRAGGLDAIDELLELLAGTGDRVGYLLAGGAAAVKLLGALRPLSRLTYTHLACQPLTARALERVIMARHKSTGLRLKLGKRIGDTLGAWTRARLFDAHFDYARGNVGYALRSWITHVDHYADDVLAIRAPDMLDWDAIDDLRPELIAILVELVLHKSADADKLQRVTDRPAEDVADAIAELCAIGLTVQNRRRIVQINPFVHVPIVDWLQRRQLA